MLYSKILGKTKKEAPRDEPSLNAQLLIRGGFVDKEMSGVFAFLPLGYRVLQNIIQIIREEMIAIGGQEVVLGALQNKEVWEKTSRWDDNILDVWFKTKLKNDTEIGLATTHEEPLVEIAKKHVSSYKDLPIYAFQFQTKFRNELRAKSGLLRTREFIMKDLYSFNESEEDLDKFYEQAKQAYIKVFERTGLGDITFFTFASGGSFSKFSHEFQTLCETGEDVIYLDENKKIAVNKEVHDDENLKELGLNKKDLVEKKAIEVGNIFKLKTRFSEPLGLTYTDKEGKSKNVIMGSYGLGPARLMAAIVETFSDNKGIVWPQSVAPFRAHLVGLNLENTKVREFAYDIYNKLQDAGVEVLFDEREDVSAGQKFSDADLIGCPYRLVVSEKTNEGVEIKKRNEDSTQIVSVDELINLLK